jgi:hypothetical protein
MSSGALITDGRPKRAKRVTGTKAEARVLKELQAVNKAIEKKDKIEQKKFERSNTLFDKRRKLQEQLGI